MTFRSTIAALTVALTLTSASPANAHHGYAGPVRLYLETVNVEPRPEGWFLRAAVNDSGSGKPAPGFVVHATGSGPEGATFGPVTLADGDADGRYETELGALPTGDWSVTVEVGDAPGSDERAIPITRTWPVTLQPARPPDATDPAPAAPRTTSPTSSGSTTPLALAALIALLATSFAVLRRRSAAIPAP